MYNRIWESCFKAVCNISFFMESGIKVNSITGFRFENYIVTDEFIYKIKKCHEVLFQFVEEDGFTLSHTIKISQEELNLRFNHLAEFENEGYALIDMSGLDMHQIPSLQIDFSGNCKIGMSVAILGFHGDQENLSFKNGIISSFVKMDNGKKYIQFDAAIKQGNSGSPVINIEHGRVIGVVGYRLSTITRSYEAFKEIIDENLKLLKKSEGKMNIMDIDPIQVLIANQNQLKQISREFYRTAMMSYGFAHQVFTLKNYAEQPQSVPRNMKI